LALTTVIVAACAAPPPPSATPIDAPASPVASPTPLADAARDEWRTVSDIHDDPATAVGIELRYGRFGAPARVFERPFAPLRGDQLRWGDPIADGPIDGTIAAAFRDGDTSEIWSIDVLTGAETKVAERPALISGIELDLDAGEVHLLETTLPLEAFEVVTLRLADGAPTSVVTVPVAEVARQHVATHLDPSTGMLLVLACGFTCELTGVDLAASSIAWSRPSDHRALSGVVPGVVLASHGCNTPCATQLVDPVTGIGARAAETCGSVALGIRSGALAIATDTDGEACPEMDVPPTIHVWTDPWTNPVAARVVPDDLRLATDGGGDTGFDVDPGVVLLLRSVEDLVDEPTLPRRLDLSTGELAPLS
jgi:hypothetical protein